jgi:23S rRNA pseudouridine1911/1915/1917 synthase
MQMEYVAKRDMRLSQVLREEMGLSAGLVNRLKWQQKLFVGGIPRHTDYIVRAGEVVCVPLEAPAPNYQPEDGALEILYEDSFLLAVDKPAGMLIHPSRSRIDGTLANRVLGYYRRSGQDCAFHPITRLDRDTFGVVLLAKNPHIHAKLNQLHAEGALQKPYHALVLVGPGQDTGTISAPIARLPLPSLLRQVQPDGKPAITNFSVLERKGDFTRLALQPVTGRTHQLRVHCAYMGFPILGDPQYGSARSIEVSRALNLTGQQLCAKQLKFPHPATGETVTIQSVTELKIPY